MNSTMANFQHFLEYKAPLAAMIFKVVDIFLAIFPPTHFQNEKTEVNNSNFIQKMNPSTHGFKFLMGALKDAMIIYI